MNTALTHICETIAHIRSEMQKEIIGQDILIDKLLITVFASGHALLEGVPGLGKTKTVRTLATVLGLDTKRISFTPDLLPSDLTGNEIYKPKEGKFEVRKGPIFTSILLADEINRTPPKVQSALLEAMEEKKVTIGEKTFDLPSPFIVFATQNPLEHEGTYPLPEAQLDRFLMRIIMNYPRIEDEKRIFMQETSAPSSKVKEHGKNTAESSGIYEPIKPTDLLEMIEYISESVQVDSKIYDYVSDILTATRKLTIPESRIKNQESNISHGITDSEYGILSYGASTRAGLALIRAGRVRAVMSGRDYMLPDDVKFLAHNILDHRIGLSYEAMSEGITTYQVTENILNNVRVP